MSDDTFTEQVKALTADAMQTGARLAFGHAAALAAECETGEQAARLIQALAARSDIWGVK